MNIHRLIEEYAHVKGVSIDEAEKLVMNMILVAIQVEVGKNQLKSSAQNFASGTGNLVFGLLGAKRREKEPQAQQVTA
jgi:hypothetical protein